MKFQRSFIFILFLLSLNVFAENIPHYFGQKENTYKASIPYGYNETTGKYVDVGDTKIWYEVYGKGSPIVVLHGGIVGSTVEMGEFIDNLSKDYLVIAISTRGHGKSKLGKEEPSYARKAKDVLTVIEKITNEKVDIIGFSDGAYTGYFFSKNYPDKINRLVAIGAGEWKKGNREFNLNYEILSQLDSRYWEEQLKLQNVNMEELNKNFARMNKYYNDLNLEEDFFIQLKTPTLLIVGENDQNAPLKTVLKVYETMDNAQLSVIPAASHSAFIDNFPAIWAVVKPFLKEKNN